MAIIQSHINPELQQELVLSCTMHSFIMNTYPDTITIRDERMNLFSAYVHLADDLYGSILHLISGGGGGTDGGAFALIRPLVEASIMAQWLYFCASEDNVKRAHAGEDIDPGLSNMMEALDKAIGNKIFANLRKQIKTLHGFTHGGIEQLARRFDGDGNLCANYTDADKTAVLRSATAMSTLLSGLLCKIVSGSPQTDERCAAIDAKYMELYGTNS